VQRLCAHLTGALEEREAVRVQVGERARLPASAPPAVKVKTPSGGELRLETQPEGWLRTPPLPQPGVYTALDAAGQPIKDSQFAAFLDPSESDLTRLMPDALSHTWGEDVVVTSTQRTRQAPVPLWTWVLLAAVAAFFGEGLLLRKP
jgi:hypothetical protein